MYNEYILNIFETPANVGMIKNASASSMVADTKTGEVFRFYIKVEDGVITQAKFKTFGGVVAIVASSLTTQMITDTKVEDLVKFSRKILLNKLGEIPDGQEYIADLIEDAMTKLYEDFKKKERLLEKLKQKQAKK